MTALLRFSLLSLIVYALAVPVAEPAIAQAQVLVTPEALTIRGIRGETTSETRTLTLRATSPVNNLRIYAFDLYNAERDRIFPKRLITVPTEIDQLTVDTLQSFPVVFDLQEAPSGEFQGNLLLTQQGNEVSVPVTIRVKDPWYLPLALLVLGGILGTTVSSYSRWGRTVDEVTVSLETLRSQYESDNDIPSSFAARISAYLEDAKLARDTNQLESARQAIETARGVWRQWFRQRTEWLEMLNVGKELEEKFASLPLPELQTRYTQKIQQDLKHALTSVVDFASPSEFGQQINRLAQQQAVYLQVYRQLFDYGRSLDSFKPTELDHEERTTLQTLRDQAVSLKQQLDVIQPSESANKTGLETIETELNQAIQTFERLKQQVQDRLRLNDIGEFKRGQEKSLPSAPLVDRPVIEPPIVPSSEVPASSMEDNPVLKGITALIPNPTRRLQLFSIAGYLTTIAFLAGAGFNQLYLQRPTFGADGLRDYFTLFAWGFGAEATRSAVTNALRRTDESKS